MLYNILYCIVILLNIKVIIDNTDIYNLFSNVIYNDFKKIVTFLALLERLGLSLSLIYFLFLMKENHEQ